MTKNYDLDGISPNTEVGKGGPRLKFDLGLLQVRRNDDTTFSRTQGADSVDDDDFVTRRQLLAVAGTFPGESGNIYENLQGYIDSADRNSYPGSGASVTDMMGNATAGTIVAPTIFRNGAFQFDGASGVISFTKNINLDDLFDGGGTAMVFLRPNSDGEGSVARFLDTTGAGAAGWTALTNDEAADGTMRVRFIQAFDTTNGDWETTDTPLRNDTWNSVAFVYDSTLAAAPVIYVNTAQQAVTTLSTPVGTAVSDVGNDLRIGNRQADDRTFDGEVAIVLLFNRNLSQTEVNWIHNLFQARFAIGYRGRTSEVSGFNGGDFVIAGGDYLISSGVIGHGGDVEFRGGNTASTNSVSSGGEMRVTGGSSVNGPGGNLVLLGGETAGGIGSTAELAAGSISGGANAAANCTVHGGDHFGTGAGGDAILRGGKGGTTGAGNGGDVAVASGQPETLGTSGNVIVRARGPVSGTTGITGDILITTQAQLTTGPIGPSGGVDTLTGNITITTRLPGNDGEQTGDIDIETGDTGPGAASGTGPGTIRLRAGNSQGGDLDGGNIFVNAGHSTGNGDCGVVRLTARVPDSGTGTFGRIEKQTDLGGSNPTPQKFRNFEYQSTTTASELAITIDGGPLANDGDAIRLRVVVSGKDTITLADYTGIQRDVVMRRESAALITTIDVQNDRGDAGGAGAWGGLTIVGIVGDGSVQIRLQGDNMVANTVDWWGWVEYMEQG